MASYKTISKVDFTSFKWCNIYPRENEEIYIYDYFANNIKERFIFKINGSSYIISWIFPLTDKGFKPLDLFDSKKLESLNISKMSIKENLDIFMHNKIQSVIYNEDFNGVIVTVNQLTFMNLLSTQNLKKVPKGYTQLSPNWFYFK